MRACAALLCLVASTAHAGGQFLPVRGVRPAARGGAFVAGADDPGALWYNPAGLAALIGGAKREVLLDIGIVGHEVTFSRIDSGGTVHPPVRSDDQLAPLPTIAAQLDLSPRLSLGFGVLAPWSALDAYPEDGAQRYTLVSTHHSALLMLEAAVAYRISDRLAVGAGVQNLVARIRSRMVFSACPAEIFCAPEDPEFDALGEVDGTSWFSPSAILGATARPLPWLGLGAAVQLPFAVSTSGTVRVRLPSSGFFNGAHVEGDRADVSTTFPLMVRGGVEIAPAPWLELEAGIDWEMWSQQDELRIRPRDVRVEDAAALGTYGLNDIVIPRKLKDTLALRVGLETRPIPKVPVTLRAGYVNETGSTRPEYLSVLTVDTDKHVLTAGLGVQVGPARIDAVVGRVIMADRTVARGTSCVPQVNPIRTGEEVGCARSDDPGHVYVGDGTYRSSWTMFGGGVSVGF
jgi:long-chain fatty acid transport protein